MWFQPLTHKNFRFLRVTHKSQSDRSPDLAPSPGQSFELPGDGRLMTFDLPQIKFKNPADYLTSRGIDDLQKIVLTTEDVFSFSNALKSCVEDCSGTAWIWWLMTPQLH
jgi:hypothetical protein